MTQPHEHPVGARFDMTFAPEATIGAGWRRVTFEVVMYAHERWGWTRGYGVVATVELGEDEADGIGTTPAHNPY